VGLDTVSLARETTRLAKAFRNRHERAGPLPSAIRSAQRGGCPVNGPAVRRSKAGCIPTNGPRACNWPPATACSPCSAGPR
jgi:hypothetical protein